MTTVNDFTDILRIIREQPEWGDALRSALLSQKLLELPERFAEFVETANKRFAALEGDVAELKAGQARLESAVSRLEGRVGNSRGTEYEIRVGKSIATTIGRHLGLVRVRILKGHLIPETAAFRDLIDTAQEQATITIEEREDFDNVDLVLRGRSIEQSTVYVVLEVSLTAGDRDIHRAADRAETLRRATGETTFAAVVSANWDASRQQLAEERGVVVVTKPEE